MTIEAGTRGSGGSLYMIDGRRGDRQRSLCSGWSATSSIRIHPLGARPAWPRRSSPERGVAANSSGDRRRDHPDVRRSRGTRPLRPRRPGSRPGATRSRDGNSGRGGEFLVEYIILDGVASSPAGGGLGGGTGSRTGDRASILAANETMKLAGGLFDVLFAACAFILFGLAVAASEGYSRWLGLFVVLGGAGESIGAEGDPGRSW